MKSHFNHSGSTFDSFLEEEGIREEVETIAVKRILAWQFQEAMREQGKTKQAMARELGTSRSQLDRLLDPTNTSISLETIARAADVLGKRVVIQLGNKTRPKRKRKVRSTATSRPIRLAKHPPPAKRVAARRKELELVLA